MWFRASIAILRGAKPADLPVQRHLPVINRAPLLASVIGSGILETAIRLQLLSATVGQLSRGELAGRAFKTLDHDEASDFASEFNLKTAKALGLEIPPGVLALADEVIE